MKPTVLVRNRFLPPVEQRLADEFDVVAVKPGDEDQLRDAAAIAGVATNGYIKADAEFMARLPNLKIIASMAMGVDHIDLDCARTRGIVVTNIADVHNECVADLGLGLIIAATRNLVAGDRYVRAGKWPGGPAPLGLKIGGKTLGVLGLGRVGSLVARRAAALGMKVAYCSRRPVAGVEYDYVADPVALARRADILLVMVPATRETQNLISAPVLDALGPDGILVNLARGSIIDDDALIRALRQGGIRGAALDVFRNEPNVRAEYLELDNVVLTPHIGSATTETRIAMGMAMTDNLTAFFANRLPPNRIC